MPWGSGPWGGAAPTALDIAIANRVLATIGGTLLADGATDLTGNEKLNAIYPYERDALLSMHPWNFALKRVRLTAAGLLDCSAKTITIADADPDTITDSGSGLVSGGFEAGGMVSIIGSASNNTVYGIASVISDGSAMTLESHEEATAEVLTNDADLKLYALSAQGKYKYTKPSDCLRVYRVNEIDVFNQPVKWALEGKFVITEDIDENDQITIQYIAQITNAALFDILFEECFYLKLCAVMSMASKESADQWKMWQTHFQYKFLQATGRNAFEGKTDTANREETGWEKAGR
jgi:hypothetical protein